MKKFRFSLETVMDYRNQLLEDLKAEHGKILSLIREKEEEIRLLEQEFAQLNAEFNQEQMQGMVIQKAVSYKTSLKVLEKRIEEERLALQELNKQEEKKREQVVSAKKDALSLEKLKEKRLEEYNHALLKEEENLIDEFVSNTRSAKRA